MHRTNYLIKAIKEVFKQELKIKVNSDSKLLDLKAWDSLGNFNVLLACEKKFKIKFSESEFSRLNSFKGILEVVKKKTKK